MITQHIPKLLSMVKEITYQEVEEVLMSMPSERATGCDGFTEKILHTYWAILGRYDWQVIEALDTLPPFSLPLMQLLSLYFPNPLKPFLLLTFIL